MSEWFEVSLGDLFSVKHGFAFKGEFFCTNETKELLVTPGNFSRSGGFQNNKPKYYNGPIPENYILTPGELVITMTDLSKEADTLGFAALIPKDSNTWLHNQRVGLVILHDSTNCDLRFLSFLLRSRDYRSWVIGSATGTTVKHTSPRKIETFSTKIPPLPEQKAIAHILGTLDDKIELNRRQNETLEAMAQALFKSWFVDFDPVLDNALAAGNTIPPALQKKAAQRQAVADEKKLVAKNPALAQLFPASFEFNEELGKWVPEGWEVRTIGELAKVSSAKRIFAKEYQTSGIPFFRGKEITLLSQGSNFESEIFISKERFNELKNKHGVPLKDDILLTSVGTIGNTYLVEEEDEFYFKDGNLTWFTGYKTEIEGKYLKTWFESKEAKLAIDNIKIGSTQQAITITSLNSINLVLAQEEILKAFNKQLNGFITECQLKTKQTETLALLRDTLLPQLISGKVRVPAEVINANS